MTDSSESPAPTGSPEFREALDRFADQLAGGLSAFLGAEAAMLFLGGESSPEAIEAAATLRLGRICESDSAQGAIRAVDLLLSPEAAMRLVGRLLGEPVGMTTPSDRPPTDIEARLLARLTPLARAALQASWPRADRPSLLPPDEDGAPEGASVSERALAAFRLTLGEPDQRPAAANLWLSLPSGLLPAAPAGPASEGTMLELTAELPETALSDEDLAGLQPGDLIETEAEAGGQVVLRIGGIPRFLGRLGRHNGRQAVTVIRRIEDAEDRDA